MAEKASAIIAKVEAHCGMQIPDRRLRFQIIETLQAEIDRRDQLESRVFSVLNGCDTFNPMTHKAIRLSNNS